MCLLKPNERANNCSHEECKHFPMFNRPSCMYNANPASKLTNVPISANFAQSMQNQQKPMFQTMQFPENIGLQQVNCPKDIFSNGLDENCDDEEVLTLNKKKVKVDNTGDSKQVNLASDYQSKNYFVNPVLQQYTANSNSGDKMVFNTPQLNNILIGSTMNGNNAPKTENIQYVQLNQPMYVPFMQNPQGNNNFMAQNVTYIPIQQQNMQSPFQNFAQNIKIKPNMSYEPSLNVSPSMNSGENIVKDNNKGFNIEEFMKDVQGKLVDLLFAQNKMLIDLREKNELVQDTLACLINEVNSLKQVVKQNNSEKSSKLEQMAALPYMTESSREAATSETLLNQLYGAKQDFQYQLVLKNDLSLPLYRERNFKFTVMLTDRNGNPVKNTNRIPLTIAIYTSENPPKFVDVNTSGNKILKGMVDKDLVDGVVTFDKIQIKEVTSHFRNGWIFFVVYPKAAVTLNTMMAGVNGVMVNSSQIKPFVLEKVVVKAKRSKEKEDREEREQDQDRDQSCDGEDNKIYEPEQ